MEDKQQTLNFQAADERAEAENRRREFRKQIVYRQGVPESVERLLIALDSLSEEHGFVDGIGNTILDPSKYDIADAMGMSVDTARRCWKWAEREGLITIEEVSGRTSVFTVLWPVMFARAATPSTTLTGGGSRGSSRGGMRGSKRGLATPKNGKTGGWQQRDIHGMSSINVNVHESMDGPLEIARPGKGWTLKLEIDIEHLRSPEHVQELWELCLTNPHTKGLFRDEEDDPEGFDRTRFFALSHAMWRKREKLTNAVGLFHHFLLSGPAKVASQADDGRDFAWAERAIRQLKRDEFAFDMPQKEAAGDPEAREVRAGEASRSAQLRALWEMQKKGAFDS